MNESEFYYLGKITRKFSFKGELILFLDTDSPSLYYNLDMVFLKINGSFIPYFISQISKYKNNSVRIKFEDVYNEDMASEQGWLPKLVDNLLLEEEPKEEKLSLRKIKWLSLKV